MKIQSNHGRSARYVYAPTFAWLGLAQVLVGSLWADPAVSGLNGKLGASYGRFDVTMDDISMVEGSIAWPLADAFGLQIDGMYAHGTPATFGFAIPESVDYGGFGGHIFWRDPSLALVGLEGAYVFSGAADVTAYQIGLESEYYLNWLTLGLQAGYSEVDDDQMQAGDGGFYARLSAGCYPVNNLLVNAILETRYDNLSYGLELEYETPVKGLSVFASAMNGEHSNDSVFAGMRYYFGGESDLKSRHRNSDPPNRLPGLFSGIQSFQADQIDRAFRTPLNSSGSSNHSGVSTTTGGSTYGGVSGIGQIGSGSLTLGGNVGSGSSTLGTGNYILGGNSGSGSSTLGGSVSLSNLTIVGSGNLTIGSASGLSSSSSTTLTSVTSGGFVLLNTYQGSSTITNATIRNAQGLEGVFLAPSLLNFSEANSYLVGGYSLTNSQEAFFRLDSGNTSP